MFDQKVPTSWGIPHIYICIYVYMYICICVHIDIYIYMPESYSFVHLLGLFESY